MLYNLLFYTSEHKYFFIIRNPYYIARHVPKVDFKNYKSRTKEYIVQLKCFRILY